jgi:hypothetical protein
MKKKHQLKTVLYLANNTFHWKERHYHVLKESISSGS